MVKGVIFDLDGTLVDSLDTLWRAFNAGVNAFNLPSVTQERLFALMNKGIGLADILRDVYPELGTESVTATVTDIMAVIRRDYLAACVNDVKLSDGAWEMLNGFKAIGLKIGIVTSRTVAPEKMWREFGRLEITQFVDAVITANELKRKPDPESLIECLKRLAVMPEECIFVGDSQADIRAGQAAGVRTVAIAAGVSSWKDLAAESSDFIFDNLPSFAERRDFVLHRC